MLLIALFIITLISLSFAIASGIIALYGVHVISELRARYDKVAEGFRLHSEAMAALVGGLEALSERQTVCDSNVQKTAAGLNTLAKAKANDNVMMALASIPSELLPQA